MCRVTHIKCLETRNLHWNWSQINRPPSLRMKTVTNQECPFSASTRYCLYVFALTRAYGSRCSVKQYPVNTSTNSPPLKVKSLLVAIWLRRYVRGGSRNFWLGGYKLWFRKDCWTLLRQITSPPHTPYPHSPSHQPRLHVIIPCRLTVYLDSTCKGCTLGTSSSCVWLQRLYRFRQHQCQGHDVSVWVQVLTTAYQKSCFWDMTWFVASQRMNAQLRQN